MDCIRALRVGQVHRTPDWRIRVNLAERMVASFPLDKTGGVVGPCLVRSVVVLRVQRLPGVK